MSYTPRSNDIVRPLVLPTPNGNNANVELVVNPSSLIHPPYIRGNPPNNDVIATWDPNGGGIGVGSWVHDPDLNKPTSSGLPILWTEATSEALITNNLTNVSTINIHTSSIITNDFTDAQRDAIVDNGSFQPFATQMGTAALPGDDITPVPYEPDLNAPGMADQNPESVQPWATYGDGKRDLRNLKYPLNHASAYDFIQIFPMEYKPAIGIGGITQFQPNQADTPFSNVSDRYAGETKAGSTIFLPMIPASETSSTGWGEETMNAIQKEFGNAASKAIDSAFTAKSLDDWLQGAGASMKDAALTLINNGGSQQFLTAHFAGQAVSANLLGRHGVAINPNLELLFSGPSLRSFSYNFRFTPREKDEAKEIRDIIKVFKKGMAPRRTQGNVFLNVPYVWQLEYIRGGSDATTARGGTQHPYLNKIKPCALKSFNVNYMPDGSYMTYADGGSMTSYQVSMEFGELEPIYNNDIDMASKDMGY